MLKRKRIAAIALVASLGFNFSNAEIIVKADEKLEDYAQENLVEETNDVEKEDDILEECGEPVLNNENCMQENSSDEINNCELENINLENNTSYDEDKQIEINEEQVRLQDEISSEEEEQDEEIYYEKLQSVNASNTNVTWGEDENYSWSNSKCTIYDVVFRINDDNTTVTIIDCNTEQMDTLTLPNKIKVSGKYYNVTSIGNYAFEYCISLSSITIPNSVISIGDSAFWGCSSLQDIYVNTNNKYYCDEDGILFNNDKTKLIIYPEGKKESNYTIPNSVRSIENYAFYGRTSLINITIPDSVTSIGDYAFKDCSSLSSITIPNSVTSIGGCAFEYCKSLSSIIISNSVTSIGGSVFSGCSNLSSITIPNSVTSIGGCAFEYCESLSSITIPNSVTSICDYAFGGCSSLQDIYVNTNNKYYCDECGILFNNDKTKLIIYPEGKKESNYTIPNSVRSIENYAFSECNSLINITIPDSVTSIGRYAFWNCSSLRSITIPNSVTSIGYSVFSGCSSLSSITIPDSVTSIDYCAFRWCKNLNSVWTSQLQYNKFKNRLCYYSSDPVLIESNLYNREDYKDDVIKIKADTVKCFERCSDGSKKEIALKKDSEGYFIHDPSRSEVGTKYYSYEAVKDGVTYESPEISVEVSKDTVFTQWNNDLFTENNITYLKTSNNTVSIKSCESTVKGEVVIPSKITVDGNEYDVTSISDNAFNKCYDLESVIIGDGIKNIGQWAFCECNNLRKVDIADSVTSIDTGAFALCDKLEDIKMPNNLEKISSFTFNGCTSLEELKIPEGIKTIEECAVINCSNLECVKIPSSIEEIQSGAFMNFNDNILFYVKDKNAEILLNNAWIDSRYIVTEDWSKNNQCVIDNIKYQLKDDNTVSIIGYTPGLKATVNLNNKITVGGNEYTVTSIEYNAFNKCDTLENVTIGDGIQSIGEWAFCECNNLEKVDIANSVTSIDTGAFALCNNLEQIKLPNNIKEILSFTFNDCISLENIEIPKSVETIEEYAFINCSNLKFIVSSEITKNALMDIGIEEDNIIIQ